MGLGKYVGRRLLTVIPVLIGVLVIVFLLSRVAVPNPARVWAGPRADEKTVRAIGERYHLYDPLYIQFFYYLIDLARGDWGNSPTTGQPVLKMILAYFPATLELSIAAMLIALALGIPIGVIGAVKQGTATDNWARLFSLVGVATPPFLIALVVQLVFFYYLGAFPDSGGRISTFLDAPQNVTGFFILDSLISGNWPALWSSLQHILMPAFSLAFIYFGIGARLTRASMLEILSTDYVRTAYGKGLGEWTVIYKHALRNAMIPVISVMTVMFAYMLGGSIVVESIFSWPGVGRYAAASAMGIDLFAVMGTTLVFALCVVVVNLIADILYTFVDPRIRLE
jgi:peptide/nickel transport system permease protein